MADQPARGELRLPLNDQLEAVLTLIEWSIYSSEEPHEYVF